MPNNCESKYLRFSNDDRWEPSGVCQILYLSGFANWQRSSTGYSNSPGDSVLPESPGELVLSLAALQDLTDILIRNSSISGPRYASTVCLLHPTSILLYGAETRAPTATLSGKLNACHQRHSYTRFWHLTRDAPTLLEVVAAVKKLRNRRAATVQIAYHPS